MDSAVTIFHSGVFHHFLDQLSPWCTVLVELSNASVDVLVGTFHSIDHFFLDLNPEIVAVFDLRHHQNGPDLHFDRVLHEFIHQWSHATHHLGQPSVRMNNILPFEVTPTQTTVLWSVCSQTLIETHSFGQILINGIDAIRGRKFADIKFIKDIEIKSKFFLIEKSCQFQDLLREFVENQVFQSVHILGFRRFDSFQWNLHFVLRMKFSGNPNGSRLTSSYASDDRNKEIVEDFQLLSIWKIKGIVVIEASIGGLDGKTIEKRKINDLFEGIDQLIHQLILCSEFFGQPFDW